MALFKADDHRFAVSNAETGQRSHECRRFLCAMSFADQKDAISDAPEQRIATSRSAARSFRRSQSCKLSREQYL